MCSVLSWPTEEVCLVSWLPVDGLLVWSAEVAGTVKNVKAVENDEDVSNPSSVCKSSKGAVVKATEVAKIEEGCNFCIVRDTT